VATRFDRGAGDIFDIQDEIAAAIVDNLKVRLAGSGAPAVKRVTDNIEAYNLYLKGRYYWERRNQQFPQGRPRLFRARHRRRHGVRARARRHRDCHTIAAVFGYCSGAEVVPLATASAERALELDPLLAEAHYAVGAIRLWTEWNWNGADASLRRAAELNPRLAISLARALHCWPGWAKATTRIREARRGMDLEPDSALITMIAGNVHTWLRRFSNALELLNRAVELDPTAGFIHWWRTPLLSRQGDHAQAIAATEGALAAGSRPAFLLAALGRAYACADRADDAQQLLDELLRRRKQEYVAPLYIGDLYAAIGDRERACDWFERAYEDRNGYLPPLLSTPTYDVLRGEPRFDALVASAPIARVTSYLRVGAIRYEMGHHDKPLRGVRLQPDQPRDYLAGGELVVLTIGYLIPS
jgi:serine/threonine-protein kinase